MPTFPHAASRFTQDIGPYNEKQARMESLQTSPVFLACAFPGPGSGSKPDPGGAYSKESFSGSYRPVQWHRHSVARRSLRCQLLQSVQLRWLIVDVDHIAPVQFLPDCTQDSADGPGVAALLANDLADVTCMDINTETGTIFSYVRSDDDKLRLVNHCADDLVQQLGDRYISWIRQRAKLLRSVIVGHF